MNAFDIQYKTYLSEFEVYLEKYASALQTEPTILGESMRYSLCNGGKRVRPVLMLACADALDVDKSEILPFALALEMIHTYSLIHDDLPCMDNDDFRRGKPSNHKKYGEANALLAGDALLGEAYALCFQESLKGEKQARASLFLNECAGIYGMLVGQTADLLYSESGLDVSEKELLYIYEHKTGKLLLAAVMMACLLKGDKNYLEFENFGKKLGLLFQLTDDILDVTGTFENLGKTIGKDEKENKLTCVRLYGLEGAKLKAESCAKDCLVILEGIDGNTEFLKELVNYILNRTN